MASNVYLRSDGAPYQPQGDDGNFNIVGYIGDRHLREAPRLGVLMGSGRYPCLYWCMSEWEVVIHDELWEMCGPAEDFVSKVQFRNLDFRGTPFEHRYNEYVFRREHGGGRCIYGECITKLAKRERKTWPPWCMTFVPFKKPNPQGYQGVWGRFGDPLGNRWSSLRVVNTYYSGRHVLKIGVIRPI